MIGFSDWASATIPSVNNIATSATNTSLRVIRISFVRDSELSCVLQSHIEQSRIVPNIFVIFCNQEPPSGWQRQILDDFTALFNKVPNVQGIEEIISL